MEVAGLLRMAGRRGDEQMTERLLQQLSQAQSETQSLQKKIHEYEEREVSCDVITHAHMTRTLM